MLNCSYLRKFVDRRIMRCHRAILPKCKVIVCECIYVNDEITIINYISL